MCRALFLSVELRVAIHYIRFFYLYPLDEPVVPGRILLIISIESTQGILAIAFIR